MAGEYGFSSGSTAPNNNAYGDPGESGGHLPSFQTGITGETNPANTASVFNLDRNAARFNAMVPHQMRPTFLTPVMKNPGGNGMSAGQAARRWADGTPIGNPNGIAEDGLQKAALLKMAGQDTGIE